MDNTTTGTASPPLSTTSSSASCGSSNRARWEMACLDLMFTVNVQYEVASTTSAHKCKLKYHPYSYFSREAPRRVTGLVNNGNGKPVKAVQGTWDESISLYDISKYKDANNMDTTNERLLWKKVLKRKRAIDKQSNRNWRIHCQREPKKGSTSAILPLRWMKRKVEWHQLIRGIERINNWWRRRSGMRRILRNRLTLINTHPDRRLIKIEYSDSNRRNASDENCAPPHGCRPGSNRRRTVPPARWCSSIQENIGRRRKVGTGPNVRSSSIKSRNSSRYKNYRAQRLSITQTHQTRQSDRHLRKLRFKNWIKLVQ